MHVTGSNARDGEQSTIGVSLVSDSKDLSDCEEDLEVIKESISCDTLSKNDGMSHVLVNTLIYLWFILSMISYHHHHHP